MILSGCGWFGFSMANAYRAKEHALRQLIRGLEWMEWDLQFRQTSLPDLCRHISKLLSGKLSVIFSQLGTALEGGECADVRTCMHRILIQNEDLPEGIAGILSDLGQCLGQLDLNGQLGSLRSVRTQCDNALKELCDNRENRLRSYQTLGLCTGAALAILLI